MNLKYWIIGLLMLPLFAACSSEDDIDSIFTGKTWRLTMILEDSKTSACTEEEQQEISDSSSSSYSITFSNGTFSGRTLDEAFAGTWTVDGGSQEISFTFTTLPTPETVPSQLMIEILQNAVKYQGDTNQLTIHQSSGPYMLFKRLN